MAGMFVLSMRWRVRGSEEKGCASLAGANPHDLRKEGLCIRNSIPRGCGCMPVRADLSAAVGGDGGAPSGSSFPGARPGTAIRGGPFGFDQTTDLLKLFSVSAASASATYMYISCICHQLHLHLHLPVQSEHVTRT